MSKDQLVTPAVTTAVAAAAASTSTSTIQSRFSLAGHARPLTKTSLQALHEAQSSTSYISCNENSTKFHLAVDDLPIMSWLRNREDIQVFWMSYGGGK